MPTPKNCHIHLQIADGLHLEIRDDGMGLPVGSQVGIGLSSMRERAAELGGMFQIETLTGGGTVVTVQLPLR